MFAHLDETNHDSLELVVPGLDVEKLQGISTLPFRSGALMAREVMKFVGELAGIKKHLEALCFDTTASANGIITEVIFVV